MPYSRSGITTPAVSGQIQAINTWGVDVSNPATDVATQVSLFGTTPPFFGAAQDVVSEPMFYSNQITALSSVGSDYCIDWGNSSFTCAQVASGSMDSYIDAASTLLASYPTRTFWVRILSEFNGSWFIYGVAGEPVGNTYADYLSAYKHVMNRFRANGTTNVRWVWTVTSNIGGTFPYDVCYPGDSYVDIVSFDAYADNAEGSGLLHPITLLLSDYQDLTALAPTKPLWICEMGCQEQSGGFSKGDWVTYLLTVALPQYMPRISNVLWWQNTSGANSADRLNTSPGGVSQWVAGLPFYLSRNSPSSGYRSHSSSVLYYSPHSYFKLDDVSGAAVDSSKGNNNGTYVGSPSLRQGSLLLNGEGSSVAFDGATQYVNCNAAGPVHSTNGYSIEVWAKANYVANKSFYAEGNSDPGSVSYVRIAEHTSNPEAFAAVKVDGGGLTQFGNYPHGIWGDGRPHQIVLTNNNGVILLYLDGMQVVNSSYTVSALTINTAAIAARIGASSAIFDQLAGQIAEVATYPTVLGADDVWNLYYSSLTLGSVLPNIVPHHVSRQVLL